MKELSSAQKEFCQYTGLAGAGLGLVCLIQQLYVFSTTLSYALLFSASAIAGIVAFVSLALCKKETGILLIIAISLLLLRQMVVLWFFIRYQVMMFSLIQIIFLLYSMVILILFYVGGYPKKLKELALARQQEKDYWENHLP
jgi:hypothetical protein